MVIVNFWFLVRFTEQFSTGSQRLINYEVDYISTWVILIWLDDMTIPVIWSLAAHNTKLRLKQNGCHFTEKISKLTYFNENSTCSFPTGPNNSISSVFQVMAWSQKAHY